MRTAFAVTMMSCTLLARAAAQGTAQAVPLDAAHWVASDSLRFESWQGQPSIWLNKGVALVRGVEMKNGTIEADVWTSATAGNVGIVFHARDPRASEVIFVRPGLSGSLESIQYAPALNGTGAAWQIYHGEGAQAIANIPRNAWVHLAVQIRGDSARLFIDRADKPALAVPYLMMGADAGSGVGLWASGFRQAVYFANVSYTPDAAAYATTTPPLPAGTIVDWELSPAFDAATQLPGTLPTISKMQWQKVKAEFPGLVLVNRYRAAPSAFASGGDDSILANREAGAKVVYARTIIDAPRAELRRVEFGFSDVAMVYCNGVPVFAGTRPAYFNDLGYMSLLGEGVYLPLKAGRNEVVVAVTEYFGGWAFGARVVK